MSSHEPTATNVDEYIAHFPPATQERLSQLRALIQTTAPDADESISYAIPAYKLHGKVLIYFAGYEHHVGLYPAPDVIAELAPYHSGKGTYRFPLDQPLPLNHIRRLLTYQLHTIRASEK